MEQSPLTPEAEAATPAVAVFNAEEARVLASLMEKQLTTPNNYPLSINSLTLACNQKTSREPEMNLAQGAVGQIVNRLADRGFTSIEYGERANRVFHKMRGQFSLDIKQQAVLAVLMLRAPQTLNEIRSRTARMAEFADSAEIEAIMQGFMTRAVPLAVCFPASAGRREARYAHLLCGAVEAPAAPLAEAATASAAESGAARESRLEALERRLVELEQRLSVLEQRD